MKKKVVAENNSYPLLSAYGLGTFHVLSHLILIRSSEVGVIILGGNSV